MKKEKLKKNKKRVALQPDPTGHADHMYMHQANFPILHPASSRNKMSPVKMSLINVCIWADLASHCLSMGNECFTALPS